MDWLGLSSEYAEHMLPQIFRKDDPVCRSPCHQKHGPTWRTC